MWFDNSAKILDIMSSKCVQFVDYEYIAEGKMASASVKIIIYVKVIGVGNEYLGSFHFGLYHNLSGDALKSGICDVVSQNYPAFKSFESSIIKRDSL